jgi:hypothetical protein
MIVLSFIVTGSLSSFFLLSQRMRKTFLLALDRELRFAAVTYKHVLPDENLLSTEFCKYCMMVLLLIRGYLNST